MFTGIVQQTLPVSLIDKKDGCITLGFIFPKRLLKGLNIGASVSINGVCLTVTQIKKNQVLFDVIKQTLTLTNLEALILNQTVNIERSAKLGDEIGGHILSGHISQTIQVLSINATHLNMTLTFEYPNTLKGYLFNKGFVALNGCSLTISDLADQTFSVCLIPETRRTTTLGTLTVGDCVNIEIDSQTCAIVETVRSIIAKKTEMFSLQ